MALPSYQQLGNSVTPSENITIKSGGDGSFAIQRGDAGSATTVLNISSTNAITNSSGAAIKSAGRETIWVPATAMTPMNSTYVLGSGAASGDYPGGSVWTKYKTLDFDAATEEGGLFSIMMPKSWDKGYMSFKPVWAASGTGNVLWQLYLSSWSNGETPTNNYNAAQITAASTGNGVITLSAESTAVIPHGIDATDTQLIHGFIYRYASNGADTLAVDAKLIGIQIYYNTNLSNDT